MGPRSVTRLILIAASLLAATGGATAEPRPRGEVLLQRHCSRCHAVGAKGESPEPAAPALRELHRRYEPEALSEALSEGLLTGHPLMPEFRFPPDDVRAIIRYLESIQTRRPA